MKRRWLIAILTLPVPVAVLIPTALLLAFRNSQWAHQFSSPSSASFWLGATAGVLGFAFALWSTLTFARHGEGTPAPWDPPMQFVVQGPYCYVRNPMILGVFLLLFGEAALLQSGPLFIWFTVFVIGNCLYIPLIEEKDMARRFGATYTQYKKHVPRWYPRWIEWHPTDETMHEK